MTKNFTVLGGGKPVEIFCHEAGDFDTLRERLKPYDRAPYHIYYCPNSLADGARRRCLETVAAIVCLHVDVDFRSIETPEDEILEALRQLPIRPGIVHSGGGLHVYFQLKEPAEAGSPEFVRAEQIRTRITDLLCGDRAVNHSAALLRLPGSTNYKYQPARKCVTIQNGEDADLPELEELADLYSNEDGVRPLFVRKVAPQANGHAKTIPHDGPIDVDGRLGDMRLHGGECGIRETFLRGSAAMLARGETVDSILEQLLPAGKAAKEAGGELWDDAAERYLLERMCFQFVAKNPALAGALPEYLFKEWERYTGEGRVNLRVLFNKRRGAWYVDSRRPGAADGETESQDAAGVRDRTPGADGKTEPSPGANAKPDDSAKSAGPDLKSKVRFRLTAFKDIRPGADAQSRIDELLPMRGIGILWGKAKSLKSFVTSDMCLHAALGWEYRGRAVRQCPVVYCAFEGGYGYRNRLEGMRRHYKIPDDADVPFYLYAGGAALVRDAQALVGDIKIQLPGVTPGIVVLDTLNKSMTGSESKDVDMGAYIQAAERIRDAFDCLVVVIHHCGYDESHARGHTSLVGAVDVELGVTRDGDRVTMRVLAMRDGPEGAEITSVAQVVDVGKDEGGREMTTLVMTPAEAGDTVLPRKGGRPASAAAELVDVLRRAPTVQFAAQAARCLVQATEQETARQLFDRQHLDGETDAAKSVNARRKAFGYALKEARALGLIRGERTETNKVMLWLVSREEDYK